MLVLTPAQCDFAGKTSGLRASRIPAGHADGADKMVKGEPPRRSLPSAYLINSLRVSSRPLWMTALRVDLFGFASVDGAVRHGRYAGVR